MKTDNIVENYSKEDLKEALRAIDSTIKKCEKALPKLKEGTPQHTMLTRRIKAFYISIVLIERELGWDQKNARSE